MGPWSNPGGTLALYLNLILESFMPEIVQLRPELCMHNATGIHITMIITLWLEQMAAILLTFSKAFFNENARIAI